MTHDPVMAYEDSTYYLFCTGVGIQQMTSKDRKTWTVLPEPVMTVMPQWTRDSVPGFTHHVWAPDVHSPCVGSGCNQVARQVVDGL